MITYKIEIRLEPTTGLRFVGINEVNNAITQGGKVIRIEGGEAILEKVGSDNEKVRLLFSGCRMNVVIDD